ncbi:MAG TPA: endo-1,4-beta-xylanase [Candidatus Aquilonibacter sp.]|nr:endo-1,4-beta-xylanase [Candidatus Aquilonibacter sp.]
MFQRPWRAAILSGVLVATGWTQSLRQDAERAGVLIGTAVRAPQLSEAAYAATLAREFNMVQPEDAMKWWVVRPTGAIFDFHPGDEIVRFAQAHNMKVRGHCLLWGRANPDWLTQGSYTPAQLSQMLHEHIEKLMTHYAGRVFAWDIVNEAFDQNGNLRDSIWYNQPGIGLATKGTAYIEQAFRWARQADPHALLFYNDAEGEALGHKSDAIYEMVRDFKHRGVPIDGIGMQMHIPNLAVDFGGLDTNIARLTALGVQVQITELDVALPLDVQGSLLHPGDLIRQSEIYRGVARACLKNRGCTAIQTWGFTDKYSWIGSHTHHMKGQALPFDKNYQPKLAYRALCHELAAGRSPH